MARRRILRFVRPRWPSSSAIGATRRILLVEDSENDVTSTLEALAEAKVPDNVVVLHDGREALDYLFREGAFANERGALPDVVLLDLTLRGVNGLAVLEKVKADARLKQIPIVMLTSSEAPADLARSYGLGANACVVKPTSFADFTHRRPPMRYHIGAGKVR